MHKKKMNKLLLSDIVIFNNNKMDIPKDVWKYISQWLSDKERFYLMMICKEMMKLNLLFEEQYDHFSIFESEFYHNFTNINVGKEVYYLGKLMKWPNSIRRIELNVKSKTPFKKILLPSNITHLTTGKKFNRAVNVPFSVTHLTFNGSFNQSINSIPSSVTHLFLLGNFNQSIEGLPSSIIHLTFDTLFNQPISDNIPSSVSHLTFGWYFNQPVNGFIPSSVTHLTFSRAFNQSIDNIPSSVTHLKLYGHYPHSFKNLSVTHLTFQGSINTLKENHIPSSVIQIILNYNNHQSHHFYELFQNPIPSFVKEIIFKDNVITEKKLAYINKYVSKETKIIFSNP